MSFLKYSFRTIGLCRSVHTSAVYQADNGLRKWFYNLTGFNKYGLRHDDILNEIDEDVAEAVRRLPDHINDERNYRLLRASQLLIQKSILPKEEWTKFEEDEHYLEPYIEEVKREREEKAKWEAQ